MPDTVIKVQNLSKLYRLGELHKQTNSFRDRVTNSFHRALGSLRRVYPVESGGNSTGAPCSTLPALRHFLENAINQAPELFERMLAMNIETIIMPL